MPEDPKRSEIRDSRRILRQIQSHINQTALNAGAHSESIGFVDVIHHTEKALPAWNYVTPRQKTAWVSAHDIEQGLQALRAHNRTARVVFNEALFLPRFASNLLNLGLSMEQELPIMVRDMSEQKAPQLALPDGISIEIVSNSEGGAVWWYVWRSAYYNVFTNTASPAAIGMDLYHIAQGTQVDMILYRRGFAIGVSRITLFPENGSAQIMGTAIMREAVSGELLSLLQRKAVTEAVARGCTLIFSDTQTELERVVYRENGFVDCGSVVCYAEKKPNTLEEDHDETVEQPVFSLR